jgi:hypothetical protein
MWILMLMLLLPVSVHATTLTATTDGLIRGGGVDGSSVSFLTTNQILLRCPLCPTTQWFTDRALLVTANPERFQITGTTSAGQSIEVFNGVITNLSGSPSTIDFTGTLNAALLGIDAGWSGRLTADVTSGGVWALSMTTAMPEPSTLALLAPGLALYWLWRRHVS